MKHVFISIIVAGLTLSGCSRISPNYRVFIKGNIVLKGSIPPRKGVEFKYSELDIGSYSCPISEPLPIFFQLFNGEKVYLPDITLVFLRKYVDNGIATESTESYIGGWPENSRKFYIGSGIYKVGEHDEWHSGQYGFQISDKGKLLHFGVTEGSCENEVKWKQSKGYNVPIAPLPVFPIVFWKNSKEYHFPITQNDAVELFGRPDSVQDILVE